MFQFHFGTIRSITASCRAEAKFSFNSTLVRLEAGLRRVLFGLLLCFNSTLVRLEELLKKDGYVYLSSFNSTLVRLEEAITFSFSFLDNSVSIPLWYD